MTSPTTVDAAALSGIGFRIADTGVSGDGTAIGPADIEATLLDAVEAFPTDLRLAALVLTWVKVHGEHVIVEKLGKLAIQRRTENPGAMPWLSAVAAWAVECGSHKWGKLVRKAHPPRYLPPREVTESAIARKGREEWAARWGYRVPKDALRIRERDVLTPAELIARNPQYRNRYLFGPSWRADIVTAIQSGVTSPAAISRVVGCSYEPARRVATEYLLAASQA